MSKVLSVKTGFIDLAGALFVIGGVISLILSILMIPIGSVYPFTLPDSFSFVGVVVLIAGLVCSLGAIHCYTLASKRLLSQAGIRGIVFGAILLILSLGFVGVPFRQVNTQIGKVSAILILVGGAICFVLRENMLSNRTALPISEPIQSRK